MDALARQPGALVEAVLLGPRLRDANCRLDDGTARWRAADGEHGKDALAQPLASERPRHGEHADRIGRGTSRRDGDELGDT